MINNDHGQPKNVTVSFLTKPSVLHHRLYVKKSLNGESEHCAEDAGIADDIHDDKDSNSTFIPRGNSKEPRPPTFLKKMIKTNVKLAGNTLALRCRADGRPTPNITWYKDNRKPERSLGKVRYSQWGISLDDLVVSDAGNYTCVVCNYLGCIDYTYDVDVLGKCPSFKVSVHLRVRISRVAMESSVDTL